MELLVHYLLSCTVGLWEAQYLHQWGMSSFIYKCGSFLNFMFIVGTLQFHQFYLLKTFILVTAKRALSIWELTHSSGSAYCLLIFKTSIYSLPSVTYLLLELPLDDCCIVWIEPQYLLNVLLLFRAWFVCICGCPFHFIFLYP